MTNVLVARKRDIKVSMNATAGIVDSNIPVTLKQTQTLVGPNRLDRLLDVDATGEIENATLVYNADTDKYVVKKLDFANVTGSLDGGIF
jgi:hypothetical protein